MKVNSASERFKKICEKHDIVNSNFKIIHKDDLAWVMNWAEYGVMVYKLKEGNDDLGEWRPSTDQWRSEENQKQTWAERDYSQTGSERDVLDQT